MHLLSWLHLSPNLTDMNKRILLIAVVLMVVASACVSKHPKCAAYDQTPATEVQH